MSVTRREFLRDGSRAAAGIVLGFHFGVRGAHAAQSSVEFAPNAYIRIGADNVVRLWATRSEMGEGVRTILPMVLADELGADWEKVVIEQAAMEPRFKGIRLRTSGSGSAAGTWRPLRKAAATAREMLVSAAAEKWNVSADSCRAEKGSVVHTPSGRKFTFGELAEAASRLPVPASPKLKDRKDLRLVGTRIKRRDSKAIVSGAAIYGQDVRLPGMLHAVIARCPYLGGKMVSFDPAPALKVEGVKHVVPVKSGFATGVAVVAMNTWAAIKGREALKPVWDKGPNAGFDSDQFTRQMERAFGQDGFPLRREGDAPKALAASQNASQRTMEALYEYPFQAHAPLETMNCTAEVRESSCEIWVPTQAPEAAQKDAAKLLGIAEDAVKVNVTLLGGGFGRRLQTDYVPEAVEISKAVGAPVQVMWTRDDDMKYGFFHPPKLERLRAALDDQGLPVAWHHKSSGPHLSLLGPSAEEKKNPNYFADDGMLWGSFDNPYNFAHHWADYVLVESPVPTGPWRAVMYPSTVFARESFLDEIAHAGKLDPIELRLRLLQPGDMLDLKATMINRARLIAVLRLVAEKSGWPAAPREEAGRLWGRGVACNVYDGDCYVAQVADVSLSKDLSDIKVHRIVSAIDCGLVLNPLGLEGQTESAIAWGMTPVLGGKINFKNAQAQEHSFADFKVPRMNQAPRVETYTIQGADAPGGFGETAVPTVAPAIANAIFAATGKRVRRLPIRLS
ncbi:MAG: molybdopterin-dependent oxidoreductase [Acidobacteriia bacterium]|nr:molybdopterin-dependent oxidoreductase [Terriglobia bacterium]